MTGPRNHPCAPRGFTLIELAVALFVIALLVGSVLVPLHTQVEVRKIEETQRSLGEAREALLGYAAAFGYFPCPANDTSAGMEPTTVPPPNNVDHTTGKCPTYHGFLPAALLGLPSVDSGGYAIDPWGGSAANRIRYAISNHTVGGITNAFTRSGGMAAVGVPSLGAENNLFHICGSGSGVNAGVNCGVAPTLATNAVAVIWSVGPNAVSGGTSVHEAQNPNPAAGGGSADRLFVNRVRASSGQNEFDDILVWLPVFSVVSKLVASGQLP